MEYTEGYLAFLDILGFSNYVGRAENFDKTYGLFEFIKKYCYLFNSSPQLNVGVSFFSDTIIITAKTLDKLILPVYIAESYLKKELGLLFRGAIVFGKYFHKEETTFGPAVVDGYALEKKAIYSRILIGDSVTVPEGKSAFYFTDIDGLRYLNPFGMIFTEILASAPDGIVYPQNITQEIIAQFRNSRGELLDQIQRNKGTVVIDKYLWRVRAYNHFCQYAVSIPNNEVLYAEAGYVMNDKLRDEISKMILSVQEM